MRFWIFVLLTLTLLANSYAMPDPDTAIAQAYIFLSVINEPPVVTEVQLTPRNVYTDSVLECLAKINDEQLDRVKLHYAWTINGKETVTKGYKLSGFNE